jgi:hypothetical protein
MIELFLNSIQFFRWAINHYDRAVVAIISFIIAACMTWCFQSKIYSFCGTYISRFSTYENKVDSYEDRIKPLEIFKEQQSVVNQNLLSMTSEMRNDIKDILKNIPRKE